MSVVVSTRGCLYAFVHARVIAYLRSALPRVRKQARVQSEACHPFSLERSWTRPCAYVCARRA
eukprot:1665717-Pleurochrysis_carterae.AAC.1